MLAMYCSYYAIARIAAGGFHRRSASPSRCSPPCSPSIILGEVVRWRRWTATIVGFLGVLVMVRPGTGTFQTGRLFALGEAFSVAFLVTLVKRLPARETTARHAVLFRRHRQLLSLPAAI